ncbi:MAG: hypothetical protein Q8N81_01060 [bacterium]|nr:hypothetical protein [bacterium]
MEDGLCGPQRATLEAGRHALLIALAFDVMITLVELVGAMQSNSLMLWENFGTGLYDGILIYLNIVGLESEHSDNPETGRRIAFWSDAMLAAGYSLAIVIGIFRLLHPGHPVNGALVLAIASAAALVTWFCSQLCPTASINGRSAQLKLRIGSFVGAATVLNGAAIHLGNAVWVDAVITITVGVCVVVAVVIRHTRHEKTLRLLERVAEA